MRKTEREFLELLEKKAESQRELVKSEILPEWASSFGIWLGEHPFRVILPVSFLLSLGLFLIFGKGFLELSLFLFGYY